MNNLAPMKSCPVGGVQGNLNWMLGYKTCDRNVMTAPKESFKLRHIFLKTRSEVKVIVTMTW